VLCILEIDREWILWLGESASHFIDEGDGLTSERGEFTYVIKSCCPRHWVQ